MTLEDTWPLFRCKLCVISRLVLFTYVGTAVWRCGMREESREL
jgi:hypothetical protein